jgi:hypothetical protein
MPMPSIITPRFLDLAPVGILVGKHDLNVFFHNILSLLTTLLYSAVNVDGEPNESSLLW